MICGWDPRAPKVMPERFLRPATFAPATSILGVGAVAIVLIAIAWLCWDLAPKSWHPDQMRTIAVISALFGSWYLVRQWLLLRDSKVSIARDGLMHDGVLLTWSTIESAELKEGLLGDFTYARIRASCQDATEGLVGSVFRPLAARLAMLGFVWVWIVRLFASLTPWHRRVVVTMKTGRRIVLHEIDDAARLVRAINGRV
jgi:hypothetical protein